MNSSMLDVKMNTVLPICCKNGTVVKRQRKHVGLEIAFVFLYTVVCSRSKKAILMIPSRQYLLCMYFGSRI